MSRWRTRERVAAGEFLRVPEPIPSARFEIPDSRTVRQTFGLSRVLVARR